MTVTARLETTIIMKIDQVEKGAGKEWLKDVPFDLTSSLNIRSRIHFQKWATYALDFNEKLSYKIQ